MLFLAHKIVENYFKKNISKFKPTFLKCYLWKLYENSGTRICGHHDDSDTLQYKNVCTKKGLTGRNYISYYRWCTLLAFGGHWMTGWSSTALQPSIWIMHKTDLPCECNFIEVHEMYQCLVDEFVNSISGHYYLRDDVSWT